MRASKGTWYLGLFQGRTSNPSPRLGILFLALLNWFGALLWGLSGLAWDEIGPDGWGDEAGIKGSGDITVIGIRQAEENATGQRAGAGDSVSDHIGKRQFH